MKSNYDYLQSCLKKADANYLSHDLYFNLPTYQFLKQYYLFQSKLYYDQTIKIWNYKIIITIMSKNYFALTVSVFLFCILVSSQLDDVHKPLEFDKPYQEQLNITNFWTGKYLFNIEESQVYLMKGQKWFFFVEVEPNQINQWVGTIIELSAGKKGELSTRKLKNCDSFQGGVDSCFLTNKQFDYATQSIHVMVKCMGNCSFKISGQISTPYKLFPGQTVKMDFETTAYSKVFSLDTTKSQDFDQLRIILKPPGFLQFPAPIALYINQDDKSLPTRQRHDLKGMTLWDNGQGVFLQQPDATGIFTILVEGPERNVLELSTELVSFLKSNDLKSNLPYFDYIGEGSYKFYKAKVDPVKGTCLQLTTFSGSVILVGIYDEDMNEIDEQFPTLFRSYGQLQYQIPPSFFNNNKQYYKISNSLIYKIQGVKQSTFLLQSYDLSSDISHLNPQITRYVELSPSQNNQYYIDLVQIATADFKQTEFQIIITSEEKRKLDVRFFHCLKQHGADCQLKNSEIIASEVKNSDIVEMKTNFVVENWMEGVKIYKFKVSSKDFSSVINDTKRYLLTVLLSNPQDTEQLYTIQYLYYGKNIYLKEGQVKTGNVAIDQNKYYVFTNTNTKVKQIRIHVMEISGRVFLEGFTEDPRTTDTDGKQILDYHNAVRFNNVTENQTIYLKVTGKEMAYYSVQLQLIKDDERNWWNRTGRGDKGKGYNQVILVQDIPYEFHIAANEKVVYQLHTKQDQFLLDISSLLPVELCMTENLQKPPFAPNCEISENITKNLLLKARMQKGKIVNIGVQNKNSKEVKFNIQFEALQWDENGTDTTVSKCSPGVMGKMVKYNFQKGLSSCYSFYLTKLDDLEVVLDVVSTEYEEVNTIVEINEVERVQLIGTTHVFKKEEISKACGTKDIVKCPVKILITSKVSTQIRLTAQYMSGTIYLLDGIANKFSGNNEKRQFVYQLQNKVNTTVILEDKKGYHRFFAKIVEANDYWKQNTTFPSSTSQDLESNNPFYFTYQILTITEDAIKAHGCTECILLITVEKQRQGTEDKQKSKFIIECTQEERFLKENQATVSFLGQKSLAFYSFYNSKNGTILVTTNTQNQNCVKIFMKQGFDVRATGSDFDQSSKTGNLIFEEAGEGNYLITLEAIEDCHYSIDVTTSQRQLLSTIERGLYTDIVLQKSASESYIYKHEVNDSIKILTLHQNGELVLNVKSYASVKELLSDDASKIKYTWSGKDYLKIERNDTKMCVDCFYLIVITAERQTKSSIMIPSKDSQFPISIDSTLKDQLETNQTQKLRIFTDKIAQFETIVHYGSINVTVFDSFTNQVQLSQVYTAKEAATQFANISNSNSSSSGFSSMKYSKITILAIQRSSFSFGLVSDKDVSKRGIKIKYGAPEYVTLTKNNKECFRGILDDQSEQFLISITGTQQVNMMNSLILTCEIDNKQLTLNKNIAKNQMIVTIENPPNVFPVSFEFCMKSEETIFLTFIQSSRLNYFPQNSKIMVAKAMNLSFYTDGKSLIQINECTSRAVTTISSNFKEVSGMKSDIKQVRKANNIIEFVYYGPVFVHVQAASATIAWRKKEVGTGKGYGYDDYSTNKIRIDKSGGFLMVQVFPLKQMNAESLVNFEQVNYTSYLAEQEMNLYDAMNCNNGVYLSQTVSFPKGSASTTIKFDIKKILQKFAKKQYLLVGVLADAKPALTDDGNYRFIYSYQQVPISMFNSNDGPARQISTTNEPVHQVNVNPPKVITNKTTAEGGFLQALLYIGATILLVVVAMFVYRKWIRKMIKRRRRERLSDQAGGEVKYQEFSSFQ